MRREERDQLRQALFSVRQWAEMTAQVRYYAWHRPVTGPSALPSPHEAVLLPVERAAADLISATALLDAGFFTRRKLLPAQQAVAQLTTFAAEFQRHSAAVLLKLRDGYLEEFRAEQKRLPQILNKLARSAALADRALLEASHFPFTRDQVLGREDAAALQSRSELLRLHEGPARQIANESLCRAGVCSDAHGSASLLAALERDADRDSDRISAIASDVRHRLRAEEERAQDLTRRVAQWAVVAKEVRNAHGEAAHRITTTLAKRVKTATTAQLGGHRHSLVPLDARDQHIVAELKLLRDHPLQSGDLELLQFAQRTSDDLVAAMTSGFAPNGQCHKDNRCEAAHALLPRVAAIEVETQRLVDGLVSSVAAAPGEFENLLDPSLQLQRFLPRPYTAGELFGTALTHRAAGGVEAVVLAPAHADRAATAAKEAAKVVRAADIATSLKAMGLDALRKAATEHVRIAPLSNAGLESVWDVYQYNKDHDLDDLPGLGYASALNITQAALRLFEGVRDETPVRIDVKARTKRTAALLTALATWDAARRFVPTDRELALAKSLRRVYEKHTPTHILVLDAGDPPNDRCDLAHTLTGALDRLSTHTVSDIWKDFLTRPADYFGLLTELGFLTEDQAKMHGDLPDAIIEAVRDKELKRTHLTASLRAYQSFGARFVLTQKKVVIGDEMGLGKTVEALAVLAHLHEVGDSHFLVVCPAAVVSNWMRETAKHTKLRGFRLHGSSGERTRAAKSWTRRGGIAVTTYDLLGWIEPHLRDLDVAAAIFDEAHYIKNPRAKRSLRAQQVIDDVSHAVLMTGTPLENSVQEFRNLVGYLRPDLASEAPEYLASQFRRHVAPAYLRRNQEDVLTELPELVEVDEWMPMSDSDRSIYAEAVRSGNFMAMRRSAMSTHESLKMARLIEIVREAEENARKVIVFSFFRDVLDRVAAVLPGHVFGPLTGSLPAGERQQLVDRFSETSGGAVLVAQVTAGGVGLNIQAASVVVICEPQIKPTMESQAVARAHRMGQAETVQVHRLLTENSVDERIKDLLAAKSELFAEFARDSVIARQAPDAVDVSDAELARVVIAAERERLFATTGGVAR